MYCLENGFKDKTHLPIFVEIMVVKLLFCFSWTGELILEVPPHFSFRMSLCLMMPYNVCLIVSYDDLWRQRFEISNFASLIVALSQQSLPNASVHFLSFMPIEYTSGMTKTEQNRHAV